MTVPMTVAMVYLSGNPSPGIVHHWEIPMLRLKLDVTVRLPRAGMVGIIMALVRMVVS